MNRATTVTRLPIQQFSTEGHPAARQGIEHPGIMRDLIISVVIPVYNQREQIMPFLEETLGVLRASFRNYEVIVVDDASSDETTAAIRERIAAMHNARLLVLSRHQGTEVALTAGLDHAIGDYVVLMSKDLRDPPAFLPKLVARAREGYDVVYAKKPAGRERGSLPYRVASRLFYRLSGHLTGLRLPEDASEFRVLSRRVVNAVSRLKEHNRVMRIMFAYMGYTTVGIPIDVRGGRAGDARRNYADKLELALDAIIAFSNKPLRYVSVLSIIISTVSLLCAVGVFVQKLLSNDAVEGWTSLMLVLLSMFCLLFLFLAVLSEYIARILVESKNRPLYYLSEDYGGTKFDVEDMVNIV
jgi:glycosyltransferase involved in cell wall biosynthesis